MERNTKLKQRYETNTGVKFFVSLHKKAPFPSGCAKKLLHVVGRLNRSSCYALCLSPSGKAFLPTTQLLNNLRIVLNDEE